MDLSYSEVLRASKTQYPALAHRSRLGIGRAVRPEEKADSFLQVLLAGVRAWLCHTKRGLLSEEDCRTNWETIAHEFPKL